ncbi:tubulin-tyrosine ligase [Legionella israelensis]|uniref:Tubulin-tyrosine ligase n=1 Tax=Legionella israelensis TaxID=454 RepID=A0AAX1EIA7_9GAMM|nr:YheC/YheD family protein [Legionella israelensis]QBR84926.1 tubulin-tyrosine ligase [Legionella israelensis]
MSFANQYYFNLSAAKSPTSYQLVQHLKESGWKATRVNWRAHFSEANLQFNPQVAETLEYKHLLAEIVSKHCPDIMPLTFQINDVNWSVVLNQIANAYYHQNGQIADQIDSLKWILKPALLNNGQHIHVFERLSDIEHFYLTPNRLGGEHVLQRYLTEPHLLQGPKLGHKYSIRMFVILTNYNGVHIYPDGYFNIALHPYPGNEFQNLKPHLTNEHLSHDEFNVVQIPTYRYELFKPFYPQIKTILSELMNALVKEYPYLFQNTIDKTLGIFGFDFMVDAREKVWLLEANHGPCFPIEEEHPLQSSLYAPFWKAVLEDFIFPIATNKINDKNPLFEKIL